jgi:predicted transcriptional regulator
LREKSHVKRLSIEVDADTAARLGRLAPGGGRRRSEFVRAAIRKALWDLEEQATAAAYRRQPDRAGEVYLDALAWEPRVQARRRRKRAP